MIAPAEAMEIGPSWENSPWGVGCQLDPELLQVQHGLPDCAQADLQLPRTRLACTAATAHPSINTLHFLCAITSLKTFKHPSARDPTTALHTTMYGKKCQ